MTERVAVTIRTNKLSGVDLKRHKDTPVGVSLLRQLSPGRFSCWPEARARELGAALGID